LLFIPSDKAFLPGFTAEMGPQHAQPLMMRRLKRALMDRRRDVGFDTFLKTQLQLPDQSCPAWRCSSGHHGQPPPRGKAKTLEAVGQNSITERDADLRAGSLQPFAGSTRQSRIRQKKSWINSRRIETIINSARENYPGSL